jgi:hypothetical protein
MSGRINGMNSELLQQMASGEAPPLLPLTVAQFHRMQTQGILAPEEQVELIEGALVRKDRSFRGGKCMMHNPGHAGAVSHVHRVLDRLSEPHGCHARSQLPVTLDDENEPEPDVKVVEGDASAYCLRHPIPAEVRLVVEVSHSSLEFDRTTKLRMYARAGIVRYWIVNLVNHQIEAFCSPLPADERYAVPAVYRSGDALNFNLPGGEVQIPFDELLPSRFRGAVE